MIKGVAQCHIVSWSACTDAQTYVHGDVKINKLVTIWVNFVHYSYAWDANSYEQLHGGQFAWSHENATYHRCTSTCANNNSV